jgi:hypothetical protein
LIFARGDLLAATVNNLRASGWAQVIHPGHRKKRALAVNKMGGRNPSLPAKAAHLFTVP